MPITDAMGKKVLKGLQTFIKEAEEEIGLTDFEIKGTTKVFFDTANRKFFCTYFYATVDRSVDGFELEDEVAAVKWVDVDWLKNDLVMNPSAYVPGWDNNLEIIMRGAL